MNFIRFPAGLLLLLCVAASSRGQSIIWDGSEPVKSWGVGANWSGNAAPEATTLVRFANQGSDSSPDTTTNILDADRTIGGLSFEGTAGQFHLTDLAGFQLAVDGNLEANVNKTPESLAGLKNGELRVGMGTPREISIGRNASGGSFYSGSLDLSGVGEFSALVNNLRVGVAQGGGAHGILTLAQTNTIDAGSIVVGQAVQGDNGFSTSRLCLGSANTILADEILIGGRNANGEATLSGAGSLTLGSKERRTDLSVGRTNSGDNARRTGLLDLGAGHFEAYLGSLIVGQRIESAGGEPEVGTLNAGGSGLIDIGRPGKTDNILIGHAVSSLNAQGLVDLSGLGSLRASVNRLWVGVGENNGSTTASLKLATDNVIDANSIRVGYTDQFTDAGFKALQFGKTNQVLADELLIGAGLSSGQVTIATGGELNLGSEQRKTRLVVGQATGSPNFFTNSLFDLRGGKFVAHLESLTVGERVNSVGGEPVRGTLLTSAGAVAIGSANVKGSFVVGHGVGSVNAGGTVDFAGLESLTANVDNVLIGVGEGLGNAFGVLKLAQSNNIVAQSVQIGRADQSPTDWLSSLELGGDNALLIDELRIGQGNTRGIMSMAPGGTLRLGSETARVDVFLAQNIVVPFYEPVGTIDLTGGHVEAFLGQVVIGQRSVNGAGRPTGVFSSGATGKIDAERIVLGTGISSGTFNLLGGELKAAIIEQGSAVGDASFRWRGGVLSVNQFGSPDLPLELRNQGSGVLSPNQAIGEAIVYGDYVQGPGAALEIELAGDAVFDHLIIDGKAQLTGALRLSLLGDVVPLLGKTMTVLSAKQRQGVFSIVDTDSLPAGVELQIDYNGGNVSLLAMFPGDASFDGRVDLQDFGILKNNFGAANASFAQGDFNGSGNVELADFGILKERFGASVGVVALPEPSTARLAGLAGLIVGLLVFRRSFPE